MANKAVDTTAVMVASDNVTAEHGIFRGALSREHFVWCPGRDRRRTALADGGDDGAGLLRRRPPLFGRLRPGSPSTCAAFHSSDAATPPSTQGEIHLVKGRGRYRTPLSDANACVADSLRFGICGSRSQFCLLPCHAAVVGLALCF